MERRPNKRPPVDLTITGKKCKIHHNDHVVRSLDEGTNLIDLHPDGGGKTHMWSDGGDDFVRSTSVEECSSSTSVLKVDRYDARALLDELSLQQLCSRRHNPAIDSGIIAGSSEYVPQQLEEDGNEEEIEARNFERYGSLAEYSSCFLKGVPKGKAKDGAENTSTKESSGTTGSDGTADESTAEKEKAFQLSEDQLKGMPAGIVLPQTERHNTIIEHTASRIASNNQLEVFLKVKQATNADFSFLNPADELYAYYTFLKEKHNNTGDIDNASSGEGEANNPLGGLLGGYSSSSSSDDSSAHLKEDNKAASEGTEDEEDQAASKNEQGATEKSEVDDAHVQEKKRKRLERLRKWKESQLRKDSQTD